MARLSTSPAPPQTWEVPAAMVVRLSTARMDALLYGTDRVFTRHSEPTEWKHPAEEPAGRLVVMKASPVLATSQESATRAKLVRLLVRAEINNPRQGFEPARALEAIQSEAFELLEGWRPTLTRAGALFPIYRVGFVNEEPVWDDRHHTWVMTTEYRMAVEPA